MYEVIYGGTDFAILKRYRIDVKEGSDNPMVNRQSKYITMSEYFVQKGERLTSFKLKKRFVLNLVGNKASEMEAYARKNNLSFKKELDVNRILSYFLD